MSSLQRLRGFIDQFVNQLSSAVESEALAQARAAVERALGMRPSSRAPAGRASDREARQSPGPAAGKKLRQLRKLRKVRKVRKLRKKAPIQLCPVPGCVGRAAPIFGMVCAKHRDLPRATVQKYREARRAKKLKGAAGAAARTSKPIAPKRTTSRTSTAASAAKSRTQSRTQPRTHARTHARTPTKIRAKTHATTSRSVRPASAAQTSRPPARPSAVGGSRSSSPPGIAAPVAPEAPAPL